jgi:hypothetical protein
LGHAAHFLDRLDRVPRIIVDEALALYRDPDRVLHVLARAHVPVDATRAALSLGGDDGPFVVVTRDGKFVTCLGKGMSTGALHVVSREKLDAHSSQLAEQRARHDLARSLTAASGHALEDVMGLITRRGDQLTREEFVAASAFQAFLATDFVHWIYEGMAALEADEVALRGLRTAAPRTLPLLEQFWKRLHAQGHIALMLGLGERPWLEKLWHLAAERAEHAPSSVVARTELMGVALRGAWAAARAGKGAVVAYRALAPKWDDTTSMLDGAMSLTAIGLRHASAARDVERALDTWADAPDDPTHGPALAAFKRTLIDSARFTLEHPDDAARAALGFGAGVHRILVSRKLEGSRWWLGADDDVPDELAKRALLSADLPTMLPGDDDMLLDVLATALFARGAAEDFYRPADEQREVGMPYIPERMLGYLEKRHVRLAPKRHETAKPGRNILCSCGSGKKYKRCCGR